MMLIYSRNSQTLCRSCRRRIQWNGKLWIHLVIHARGMHAGIPDMDLIGDSADPWFAEKLALMETEAA